MSTKDNSKMERKMEVGLTLTKTGTFTGANTKMMSSGAQALSSGKTEAKKMTSIILEAGKMG